MKLPASGTEYYEFTATADFELDGTPEVFISSDQDYPAAGASWTAATWADVETIATNGDHVRAFIALLAGSAVDPVPVGATQLVVGTNYAFFRLTDSPEVIIRPAGRVTGL